MSKVLCGVLGEHLIILVIALEEWEFAIHEHEKNYAASKDINWGPLIGLSGEDFRSHILRCTNLGRKYISSGE